MAKYRSPFLQPPKCVGNSKPCLAVGCPIHAVGAPAVNANWQHWDTYREEYATIDGEENEGLRELFMILMLSQVTESIPPDAPYEPPDDLIWMTTEPVGQGREQLLVLLGAVIGFVSLLITGIALLGI